MKSHLIIQIFNFQFLQVLISSQITPVKSHLNTFNENGKLPIKPTSSFSPEFPSRSGATLTSAQNVIRSQKIYSFDGNGQKIYSFDGNRHGTLHKEQDNNSSALARNIQDGGLSKFRFNENGNRNKNLGLSWSDSFGGKLDYIRLPKSNFGGLVRRNRESSTGVRVKILVVFDYVNSKNLDFDEEKIKKYIGIFWNSVNRRFSVLTNPSLQLSVSGLIIINSTDEQPFITNNVIDNDRVKENTLYDFRSWLRSRQETLVDHDVAILQMAANAINGPGKDVLTGLSFIGTACNKDGSSNSGFVEDRAPTFNGVLTAAHELAHSLNVPHDGMESAKDCSASDGYIMGSGRFNANAWQFSSCSIAIMEEFLQFNGGNCGAEAEDQSVSLVDEYPSSMVGSLDQQCQIRYQDDNFRFWGSVSEDICNSLWCSPKGSSHATSMGGAVEGTPCDLQKICIAGKCSASGIPTLDEQCRQHFGDSSTVLKKDDPEVCSQLKCHKNKKILSVGPAQEGSSCGNAGVCNSGSCVGQVHTFEEQCARNFGDNYKPVQRDPSKLCLLLWCATDGVHAVSRGKANEYTSCGSEKMCVNEQCVDM